MAWYKVSESSKQTQSAVSITYRSGSLQKLDSRLQQRVSQSVKWRQGWEDKPKIASVTNLPAPVRVRTTGLRATSKLMIQGAWPPHARLIKENVTKNCVLIWKVLITAFFILLSLSLWLMVGVSVCVCVGGGGVVVVVRVSGCERKGEREIH